MFSVSFALAVYVPLHVFVSGRVIGGLGLQGSCRLAARVVFALAAASFVAGEIFRRASWGGGLQAAGALWLGLLAIASTVFVIEMIVSRVVPDTRYRVTLAAIGLVALLSGYAWFNGARPPVTTDLSVPLSRLSPVASGFTIVQLSDLHLGPHSSRERLQGVIDRVNSLSPDLVVITGDLVGDDIREETGLPACFRNLRAAHGVLAVPGNHEYYAGYAVLERFAGLANITILRNARRRVGNVVEVAGLDEPAGRSFIEGGPNLTQAVEGRDPGLPLILLAHRPESFDRHAATGVDLQLSGHTHAGQIPPLDILIRLLYPYAYGLHRKGASAIYTSCGTGTWGPPMRLFSRNEIVRLRLVHPHAG